MPKKRKLKGTSMPAQAATAIAVMCGTGLFAAALAVQRRPVRVHVPQPDLNDTDHEAPPLEGYINQEVNLFSTTKGIFDHGADVRGPVFMQVTDAYIGSLIDAAIQRSGVGFSPGGRAFTHLCIRTGLEQPLYSYLRQNSRYDIIGLETFINKEVTDISKSKSLYGR